MTEAASSSIYLDTNVFIKALRQLRAGVAATSEITLAEVLAPPKRADAMPLHRKRRVYLDLLVWSGFISLLPVSRDILVKTAELRTMGSFKLPDAIHLVSAFNAGCRFLVSADRDFDKIPDGMERVGINQSDLSRLLNGLS